MKPYSKKIKSADGIRKRVGDITAAPKMTERVFSEKIEKVLPEKEALLPEKTIVEGDSQIIVTNVPSDATFPDLEIKKREQKWFLSRFWLGVWGGSAAAVFLFVILSTVFARTTIFIKPRVETVSLRDIVAAFDISVSQNLVPQKVMPAEILELKIAVSGEFESGGTEFVEEKSRGKALIYNGFSSSPQSIVQNTRFLTDVGTLYRLAKQIIIPGAKIEDGKIVPQYIEVEFVADGVGEGYNVSGEVRLKIPGFQGSPKYEGFYAVAPAGFSGGFRGNAKVITAEDIKKAEEQVSKSAFDELNGEIAIKAPPDFKFLETMREIEILKVNSPRVNSRADKFSVEVEARARAIVFREEDVLSLLKEQPALKDEQKEFVKNSQNLIYQVRKTDFDKGRVEVSLSGEIRSKDLIKTEEVVSAILGKKEDLIAETMKQNAHISAFRFSFFPPWLSQSPSDGNKIRVIVEDP